MNVLDLARDSIMLMLLDIVEDFVMVRYLGSILNMRLAGCASFRRRLLLSRKASVSEVVLECGRVFFFLSAASFMFRLLL